MSIHIAKTKSGFVQVFNNKPVFQEVGKSWVDESSNDYFSNNGGKCFGLTLTEVGAKKLGMDSLTFEESPKELKSIENIEKIIKNEKLIPSVDFMISESMHLVFEVNYGNELMTIVGQPTEKINDKLLFHFLVGYKSEAEWIAPEKIKGIGYPSGSDKISGWSSNYILY